jgi:serine/threonine protein kinase/tetratricopeptide (TPR) repeat protein
MIGQTISHYKILEKVGEGGMGVVYKAEDTKLKRAVALKFLAAHALGSEDEKTRFVHEAQAAAALDHPNICTVYEIDEAEGQVFIAMAHIEGQSLKERIESGPLKLDQALDIAIQVAQGLQEAHEKGIVHRDIKSGNIMVTKKGQAKIMDFGLAQLSGRTKITKTGTTLGTAAYMSPEQALGETVNHRTDIWSLGVVLYEMTTGQLPFKADYEQAVVYSILNEEPEPITALRTGVPMELEQIVLKALAKNPEERYQHADEILTDLRRIKKSLETKQERHVPAKAEPKGRRWLASPILWTIIIVLFGLAGGVVLFYPTKTIPFSERDWILVTDFENITDEEIFDKSLNTALTVSIEQSKYINVFPRRRVEETLKRMKKEDVEKIDEVIGREIAEREGIKMLLLPHISRVGETYVLTGIIQEPITGSYLKTEIVRAKGKGEILNALDELVKNIRQDLGETKGAISQKSKPLAKVTTSSLEALRQYSLGEENQRRGKLDDALLYYENALQIDSTFTVALAAVGMLEYEYYDRNKGKKYLSKAIRHLDNLTDRESSGIRLGYAIAVENDLEKAVGICKTFIADYPDLSVVHNNLGRIYYFMGRYEEAVKEYKEALRTEPTLMIAYNGMISIYLNNLGQVDSALVWLKRQLSYEPDNVWPYDQLGWAYLGVDSLQQAERAFERALKIDPRFTLGLYHLSHALRLQGRYQEALQPLQKILEINPKESVAHYQLGLLHQLIGNEKEARRHFERFRKDAEQRVREDPSNGENYISLGLVLTRLGERDQGWAMAEKARGMKSTSHFGYAQLLTVLGKKQKAIDHLKLQVEQGYRSVIWMKIHPDLQPLYAEPRFKELINKVLRK